MHYEALAERRALLFVAPAGVAPGRRTRLGTARHDPPAEHRIAIRADRPGLHDFTPKVRAWVAQSGISHGLLTLFCRHTSASLLVQENAAPAARRDLPERDIALHLIGE